MPQTLFEHLGTCKLCQCEAALRKSHVIPKWCFKEMNDTKNRSILLEYGSSGYVFVQSGIKEYMLCDGCEQRLSATEREFKNDWKHSRYEELAQAQVGTTVHFHGVPYEIYRKFSLSILFRAHFATKPPFAKVCLPSGFEERIRGMLLEDYSNNSQRNGIPDDVIPTYVFAYLDDQQKSVIYAQESVPFRGYQYVPIMFAGCEWLFVLSDRLPTVKEFNALEPCRIKRDGTIAIPKKHLYDNKVFKDFAAGFAKMPRESLRHSNSSRHPYSLASQIVGQPRRKFSRTGANEPCSCGSGKKFKKCCMRARN